MLTYITFACQYHSWIAISQMLAYITCLHITVSFPILLKISYATTMFKKSQKIVFSFSPLETCFFKTEKYNSGSYHLILTTPSLLIEFGQVWETTGIAVCLFILIWIDLSFSIVNIIVIELEHQRICIWNWIVLDWNITGFVFSRSGHILLDRSID